jgi:hypothetical protein
MHASAYILEGLLISDAGGGKEQLFYAPTMPVVLLSGSFHY